MSKDFKDYNDEVIDLFDYSKININNLVDDEVIDMFDYNNIDINNLVDDEDDDADNSLFVDDEDVNDTEIKDIELNDNIAKVFGNIDLNVSKESITNAIKDVNDYKVSSKDNIDSVITSDNIMSAFTELNNDGLSNLDIIKILVQYVYIKEIEIDTLNDNIDKLKLKINRLEVDNGKLDTEIAKLTLEDKEIDTLIETTNKLTLEIQQQRLTIQDLNYIGIDLRCQLRDKDIEINTYKNMLKDYKVPCDAVALNKAGKKTKYRHDVNIVDIIKLRDQGISITDIAKKLNVGRHTIYRRLQEYNDIN